MTKTLCSGKDSVFTYLFRQPENALQLYQALHPEDAAVSAAEIEIVTLENVLVTGQYNDFGILVRNRLILLVEAQSTVSYNIPLRLLLYLADTYQRYIQEHKLSLYQRDPVRIPRPEVYMLYTGKVPLEADMLKLSDLYEGCGDVELTVHVLHKHGNGDILDQYMDFCAVFDQQVKQYGRTGQAAEEIIRICLERGILAPFLASRKKEVVSIMSLLFSQEEIWEIELYNAEKRARAEGETNTIKKLLQSLPAEEVSNLLGKPVEEIRAIGQAN